MKNIDMLQALKSLGLQDWAYIQEVRRRGNVEGLPPPGAPVTDREVIALLKARGYKVDSREDPTEQEKEAQLFSVGAAKWVSCGMQQIEMGHKFAAALLVSNVTKDLLESIKMPWPAFMIIVPSNTIFISNPKDDNKPIAISRILVFEIDNKHGNWAYLAWVENMDLTIWRFGVSTEYLLPAVLDSNYWGSDYITSELELTNLDTIGASLVGRLIVTTCVAMTMPEMLTPKNANVHEAWKKAKGDPLNLDKTKEPANQAWSLGKPITVDFRDRVKAYARGEKTDRTLELRRMVIGHFKSQAHGKGHKDRKNIWIEPYWRGPEDAVINVSPHVIKEEK